MVNIGVIGFGYWGPNLVRNFYQNENCIVKKVVDSNPDRLILAKKLYPGIGTSGNIDYIIDDSDIDGVAIALPVSDHYEVASRALLNDKNVLVEKPMTDSREKALKLIDIATRKDKILMVDHTFLYTGAVKKIKELINLGEIGKINYFDSMRINLGLFQRDINVLWDLAPHDISILSYLIEDSPVSLVAIGISHTNNSIENTAYLIMNFKSNLIAHINVSWISPVKIRQILIGGTKKMIVYNDLETTEKVKVYDTGYNIISKEDEDKVLIDYRIGDIYIPKIDTAEGLKGVVSDFINSIINAGEPVSSWKIGLEVVSILESAEKSIKDGGKEVFL